MSSDVFKNYAFEIGDSFDLGKSLDTWDYASWRITNVPIQKKEEPKFDSRKMEQIVIMDDEAHWEPRPE